MWHGRNPIDDVAHYQEYARDEAKQERVVVDFPARKEEREKHR